MKFIHHENLYTPYHENFKTKSFTVRESHRCLPNNLVATHNTLQLLGANILVKFCSRSILLWHVIVYSTPLWLARFGQHLKWWLVITATQRCCHYRITRNISSNICSINNNNDRHKDALICLVHWFSMQCTLCIHSYSTTPRDVR